MPQDQQTLAGMVRAKYPGAYDDLDDATLEKNVLAKYPQYSDLPRSQPQKGTPITDKTTIGPQQSEMNPLQKYTGQGALQDFVQTIKGYDQQGRAEHPMLAKAGDALSGIQELLTGGQSVGKKMGTSSGLVNNPVTTAMSGVVPIDMLPSAERAGKAFEAVKSIAGQHTVDVTDELSQATMRLQQLGDTGSTMPKFARQFIKRITDPEGGPLTFNEARDFYSNASRLSADEYNKLSGAMKSALPQFARALQDTISQTVERAGRLSQFQGAMSEYRNAMKLSKAGQIVKGQMAAGAKAIIPGAAAAAAGTEVYKALK